MIDPCVKLLKIIGNGPHSSRDYTYDEARAVMEALFEGRFTQAQLGALWLMMRRKTTTADELMGFLDAWEQHHPALAHHPQGLLLGNPFDGKKRSIPLSPLAAGVLTHMGHTIIIGGAPQLGPKYGLTEAEFYGHPNMAAYPKPILWNASDIYPFYKPLLSSRNDIGLRSFLHTIEKCVNPYGAGHAILTLHHEPYIERFVHLAQKRFASGLLLFGEEGSCDLCLKKPTRYFRVMGDRVEEGHIVLEEWGLRAPESVRPGGLGNTLAFWQKALSDLSSPEAQWIGAQAALLLFALGHGQTPQDNKEQALEGLKNLAKAIK